MANTYRPFDFSSRDWLRREMVNLFRDFDRNVGSRTAGAGVFPAFNMYDDGEGFLLRAEVPGVAREDLDVSAKGDQLTIRGKREISPADETANYHRRERQSGTFRRTVTLPEPVDPDKVGARFEHGVLAVYAPRAAEARPRSIDVR